ncbi:MAG: long-chain fatty acid--CoA ligase [Thermoanaerobaculia bacterium]|nr:long-chain fatty acid--CoA ligase [Thermoanaerobaculia bacterium]
MAGVTSPRTLLDFYQSSVASGVPELLISKVNGKWTPVSAEEFGRKVRALALGLTYLGVDRGDRVAILSENRPEWPMTDFATLSLGALSVPIYTTYLSPQVEYILRDAEPRVVMVSNHTELKKVLDVVGRCPAVERVILMEGEPPHHERVFSFNTLIRQGDQLLRADPMAFADRVSSLGPGDFASMIYTSGTTGEPKGAVLTHGNFVSNVMGVCDLYQQLQPGKIAMSFLPLSHVFERMVDYLYFYRGVTIAYAESVDKLAENFGEVKPHFFAAVPRVYEKILQRVMNQVEQAPALRKKIFAWATSAGKERLAKIERGHQVSGFLGLQFKVADKIVFSKIKARLGGRFEFAISGGAPLAKDVAEFFWGAGVEIYEGYGLTETSPVLTCNRPGDFRLGSVGKPLPGVSIKIAEDGEVLAKGPNIMEGYWRKPEETNKVFDQDRWFHTGDIGSFDQDGFLTLTDRKKEIIVSAYGKNIAPAPIEGALKAMRYVSSAVLVGDRRKFLSALLVPNFERLESWAIANSVEFRSREELLRHPKVRTLFQQAVDIVNGDEPSEKRIKAFTLLSSDFSIEGGELTPTLKIKRRVVAQKYSKDIEEMYAAAEASGVEAEEAELAS